MIRAVGLTKRYGAVLALDDVGFEARPGEVLGFLGPNGAGKTTTMRILTSYLPATSGVAKVAGFDVMTQSMEVRKNIGYLPESVPLYPEMRVEEYLIYRAKLKGVGRKERPRRIEYCLERCRIRGGKAPVVRREKKLPDLLVHAHFEERGFHPGIRGGR